MQHRGICLWLIRKFIFQSKPTTEKTLTIATFENAALCSAFPDIIPITSPLSEKELKFFGHCTLPQAQDLDEALNKLYNNGIEVSA